MTLKTRIILIGGAPGTGKTTIAGLLAYKAQLAHRLGIGYIREVMRYMTNPDTTPELFTFTFQPTNNQNLITHFAKQAELVMGGVDICIQRSLNEGTEIVIEGSQFLPQYMAQKEHITTILLTASDSEIRKRVHGKTHAKRSISDQDLQNILEINQYLVNQAQGLGVTVIENIELMKTVDAIIELLNS